MSKTYTATEMLTRQNLRHIRAQVLIKEIMDVVKPHIRDDEDGRYWEREKDILRTLYDRLEEAGAEIISDYTRELAGLPPRGPDGWTFEEIIELEKRRLEIMMKPPTILVDPTLPANIAIIETGKETAIFRVEDEGDRG